jgi:hypothetical protein
VRICKVSVSLSSAFWGGKFPIRLNIRLSDDPQAAANGVMIEAETFCTPSALGIFSK